ncbi:MAG: hypothetical protein JXR58_08495 [Bacteroidales bacterium]|nr:hypothetical protein [Bacteroidales bacterium]
MSETKKYFGFGLCFQSDIPLDELLPCEEKADVFIIEGRTPENLAKQKKKGILYQAAKNQFLLTIPETGRFYVQNGNKIIFQRFKENDDKSIRVFLLSTVLAALFIQRGLFPLHSGSVNINGTAILFSGISGAGKSSMVTGYYKQGAPVLNDDVTLITEIDNKLMVVPGFPRIKLWADTLKAFDENPDDYAKIRDSIEKRHVPIHDVFYNEPIPVSKIFILAVRNTPGIEIKEVAGIEKFNVLRRHTFRYQFIEGLEMTKEHFQTISRIAEEVKVYRLFRPRKGFFVPELIKAVNEKLKD